MVMGIIFFLVVTNWGILYYEKIIEFKINNKTYWIKKKKNKEINFKMSFKCKILKNKKKMIALPIIIVLVCLVV